jgi:hypothetical protein
MQFDNIMKFTMLCMRMNSTAGHAPVIPASKAEAIERMLIVNTPFSAPKLLKVIDIAHKNSVLADYNRLNSADYPLTEGGYGIFMPGKTNNPVHNEGNPS